MTGRTTFRIVEVVAVVLVLGVLIALLLPSVECAREAAKRMQCTNNLKQIGLALYNYTQANKAFPPGTVCTSSPIQPSNQYDVLAEATQTGSGPQGTGFLLRILPFIEG